MSTQGALPSWLPPPASISPSGNTSHNPSVSSNGSGSLVYRNTGSKPVSLQDIYDSAGSDSSSISQGRSGRNYENDQGALGRPSAAGDRLRSKLRPSNMRPSARSGNGDQDGHADSHNPGGYSERSGFGGGAEYDPYNYQANSYDSGRSRERRKGQGQHSGGPHSRPSERW